MDNVIHAPTPTGIYQFQGVNGDNYNAFPTETNRGSRNARTAAENIARNGPTTQATSLIVTNGRLPTPAEERGLGHNMEQIGRAGNVFLYQPRPANNRPAVRNRANRNQQ